jgi:hypothetical protein
MKIPDKVKFLLVLFSGLIFFIPGCVDTSVQSIPSSIDQRSELSFVNIVTGGGTASFTIDGNALSVDFGTQSNAYNVPAGSKAVTVNFAGGTPQTYNFSADVDYKFRVFFYGTTASNESKKFALRRVDGTVGTNSDSALVHFFNGSLGSTLDGLTIIAGTDTQEVSFESSVGYGDMSDLMTFAAGNYTVGLSYNDSLATSPTFAFNVSAGVRYTAVAYDTLGSMKMTVLTDN